MKYDSNDSQIRGMIRDLAGSLPYSHLTVDRVRRILGRAQYLIHEEETARGLESKRRTKQNTGKRRQVIAPQANAPLDPERFEEIDQHYGAAESDDVHQRNAEVGGAV